MMIITSNLRNLAGGAPCGELTMFTNARELLTSDVVIRITDIDITPDQPSLFLPFAQVREDGSFVRTPYAFYMRIFSDVYAVPRAKYGIKRPPNGERRMLFERGELVVVATITSGVNDINGSPTLYSAVSLGLVDQPTSGRYIPRCVERILLKSPEVLEYLVYP